MNAANFFTPQAMIPACYPHFPPYLCNLLIARRNGSCIHPPADAVCHHT